MLSLWPLSERDASAVDRKEPVLRPGRLERERCFLVFAKATGFRPGPRIIHATFSTRVSIFKPEELEQPTDSEVGEEPGA